MLFRPSGKRCFVVAVVFAIGLRSGVGAAEEDVAEAAAPRDNAAAHPAPMLDDRTTLRRLRKAQELIGDEQFHDALLLLAAVLDAPEDRFFKPNRTGGLERSVKVEALRLLGGMPAEGRDAYEAQFGAGARRLLSSAIEAGDAKGLREVARRFFHTRAGAVATYLLGSYELDHGRTLAAVHQFERVARHPLSAQLEPRLSAQTAACWRQVGMEEKAEKIALALQRRWPAGTLSVGDQIFRLSDPQWLSAVAVENARRKAEGPDQWLLPGGDVAHNAASSGGEPLLTPRWDAQSPALGHLAVEKQLGGALLSLRQRLRERDTAALPSSRPLAAAGLIVSRTFNGLQAVDHKTGELAWRTPFVDPDIRWEPLLRDDGSRRALLRRLWFDSTFGSLSCDGQRVFAVEDLEESQGLDNSRLRIDSRGKRRLDSSEAPRSYNRLAAYDLRTGKIAWELGGADGDEPSLAQAGVFFLGPPTPLAGSLYAICETKDEIQLRVLEQATGKLEFSQFLSSVAAAPNNVSVADDSLRRTLGVAPAYGQGVLVCPSSAGAVVAYDIGNRSLLWRHTFPRTRDVQTRRNVAIRAKSTSEGLTVGWSHTSAMVVGRRVLFAPAECGKLYCLNLSDGETLWECDREDSLYLACCVDGLVVLVGRNGARALRMESGGQQAWKVEDTLPGETAGVGYLSGGRYFLPLGSGHVAAIDVANGQVQKLLHSRKGAPVGNLVCYDGAVFSQTPLGLQRFDQRDALERLVAARGGNRENDPATLAIRGELLLNDGKLSEAVRLLRRAYRAQPAERTRSVLVDALLEGLRRDFPGYAGAVGEMRSLVRGRAESAEFLILLAEALEKDKRRQDAFAAWVEYADLDLAEEQTRSVSPGLSVRRDRWTRARIEALLSDATAPELTKMREIAVNRLAAAKDDRAALRRFLHYFAHDELADQARSRLAQHADGELTLSREFMLRRLAGAADPSLAVVGADKLASGYARDGRRALARRYVGQLATRWSRAVSPEGKSGAQLAAARAAELNANVARTAWPLGDVKATAETGPGVWNNAYPIRIERDDSPGARRIGLAMELQSRIVHGYGELGQMLFAVELPARVSNFRTSYYCNKAWISGSLVVVSTGDRLVGIDTLAGEGYRGAKIIWSRNLIESESGAGRRGVSTRHTTRPWGATLLESISSGQYQLGRAEMVGDDMMFVANGGRLVALDALTGKTAWVRDHPTKDVMLFGDNRRVYVAGRNELEAIVFDRDSGQARGRRKIPHFNTRMLEKDGRVLVWEAANNTTRLRLFDPWEQRDIWSKEFAPGAKGAVAGDIVALMAPNGQCALLKIDSGETLNLLEFDPVERLNRLLVHRSSDRIILAAAEPFPNSGNRRVSPLTSSIAISPVFNATLYAFDAHTHKAIWMRKVQRQSLVSRQPASLPLLTFAVRADDRDPKTKRRTGYHVDLLCLDKRDGRELYRGVLPNSSGAMDVLGDPRQATVELRTQANSVRLQWSKDAAPTSE